MFHIISYVSNIFQTVFPQVLDSWMSHFDSQLQNCYVEGMKPEVTSLGVDVLSQGGSQDLHLGADVLAGEARRDLHLGAVGSRDQVTRESGSSKSFDSSPELYLAQNLLMPQGSGFVGQDGDHVVQDGGLVVHQGGLVVQDGGLGNQNEGLVNHDAGLVGLDVAVGCGGLVSADLNSRDEMPRGTNINVMVHESGASLT